MGAHFCSQGAISRPNHHRVLMKFMCRSGWQITFLEEDCRTALGLHLTFARPDKILEMQERWGENRTETSLSQLKTDIQLGRPGSVWLVLTPEQYRKLRK
jgi:hypothetical protein